jgi:hypothetical protein
MIEKMGIRPYRIWDRADKAMAVLGSVVLLAGGFFVEQAVEKKSGNPSASEKSIMETEGILGGILLGTSMAVLAVPISGKKPEELGSIDFGEASLLDSQIQHAQAATTDLKEITGAVSVPFEQVHKLAFEEA